MNEQLEIKQGELGNEYTDRNVIDWHDRYPAFAEILEGVWTRRVLEVGCNRGHNLKALAELFGPKCTLVGLEPNPDAYGIATRLAPNVTVLYGTIFQLPFPADSFNLVLTAGVLRHVPLVDWKRALGELYRCSSRYLLTIENFDDQETAVPNRGNGTLHWKPDFLGYFQSSFPDLTLLRQGVFPREGSWDGSGWWLLEKAAARKGKG
jgi:SAM-dependent methyltransferase